MLRIVSIIGLALATLGGAIAGNIVPINLTTAPVGIGTCSGFGCTPTVSSPTTGTFEDTLFSAVSPPSPPTPSPFAQTPPDGPASFILAAQSGGDDTYLSPSAKNEDATILVDLGTCTGTSPSTACGLQNIDNLYTMIQVSGDTFGFQGVTVTLNGVAANGTTPVTDTILLTAGIDYRGTNSAQVTCTDANANTGDTSCTGAGSQADTAIAHGTDTSPGGTGGNQVVTYNNVFGPQVGASNYYLDVQELELGTNFLNGAYLDSVAITNDAPSGVNSRILFSGLSADTITSTPEPGTVAFLGIGLGLIALRKIRGRRTDRLPAQD